MSVVSGVSADQAVGLAAVELAIDGMTCAACAVRVEKKLGRLAGVSATVNFATGRAAVAAAPGVSVPDLIRAVEAAGYSAALAGSQAVPGVRSREAGPGLGSARPDDAAYLRRRLIFSLVFFVPLSDLSVQLSLFPAFRFPGWQWLLVALAAPVALWAAWPFHRAALRNARHGGCSMDTLVSLGIVAACGWSVNAMFFLDRPDRKSVV